MFPKTVTDACWVLGGWKNKYGNNTRLNEANDGVAFATMGNEEKKEKKEIRRKTSCVTNVENPDTTLTNVTKKSQ